MQFKDYYKILEVNAQASAEEIKKSYKKLARRYHPDVSKEINAEQQFKEVGEAYEVLKDPVKREEYDRLKAMGSMEQNGHFSSPPGWNSGTHYSAGENDQNDFSDFFAALFGGNGDLHRSYTSGTPVHKRGENTHYELSLLLEEAFNGCEKIIEFRVAEIDLQGLITHRTKKLNIKVPSGSTQGCLLRIKGQGGSGIGGEKAGDLLIRIKLAEHPLFAVDKKNLSLVVPVTPSEAALGCKVTVPTLKGKTILNIPAQSQSGQKLRLSGLGLPGQPMGDLIVVLKVVMPVPINDEAIDLFRKLALATPFNPRAQWEEK